MVLSGSFESSNPNCPISYNLVATEFELSGDNSFRIKVKDEFRDKPGVYGYTL